MAGTWLCSKKATFWKYLKVRLKFRELTHLEKKTIGDMMKYHRLKEGWSQFDLALKLGLTPSQGRYLIKDYETRGLYPPKELSVKLARLFKLNTTYFYDEYLEFLDVSTSVLKEFRLENNYPKSKASELVGTTRVTWTRWENGYPISRFYYNKLKIIQLSPPKKP